MMKNLILILINISALDFIKCELIRGVALESGTSLYDSTKPFTCLDGSSTIPFNQVNDDYCDCRDGSDEPGTSACMNSQFACQNLGYIVQYIPGSRVNDGICDCCDGSDEYNGKVQCENKCIALAAKMREEEEKMKILREQGFAKRQELIQIGSELKKSLEEKLKELENKKSKTEVEKAELEAKKNEAEQKAKEAKDIQDKIFEEKAKEQERIETNKKAKTVFELLDLNKDSTLHPEELLNHPELDILFDNDGKFTIEESIKLLDNNNFVNLESFISSYYEKLSPHLKMEETQKQENIEFEKNSQQLSNEQENLENHQNDHDLGYESEHQHENEPEEHDEHDGSDQENVQKAEEVVEQVKVDSKYDTETQSLIDQSEEARRLFDNSERDLKNLEREISDTKKKLELDLGPNGEFASMIDKCFEFEDREYVYKLCPFDRTVQKSKSNHGETSIGNWKSWGDDENKKYILMKFDNGLSCWNGPQRSTNVILSCGTENKLISVTEPNRCEYEMKFETPAVCQENSSSVHEEL